MIVVGSRVQMRAAAFRARMLNITRYIWMHSSRKRGNNSSKAPMSLENLFSIRPVNKREIVLKFYHNYMFLLPHGVVFQLLGTIL